MICTSCKANFSDRLPLCPYCATPSGLETMPKPTAAGSVSAIAANVKKHVGDAGNSLTEIAASAKKHANKGLTDIKEATKERVDAAGGVSGIAANAKKHVEVAGNSLTEMAASAKKHANKGLTNIKEAAKKRVDAAGGVSGIADKLKAFTLSVAKRVGIIATDIMNILKNSDKPFKVVLFVCALEFLIIIILCMK